MTTQLDGRTILLTGASRGIGAETARTLGAAGARLIAQWSSNREGAEAATQDIPADRKLLLQADFSQPGSARSLWEHAVEWAGRIDVLVNNAAVMPEAGLEDPESAWDDSWSVAFAINVKQPADLMREATHHFRERGGGTIITLSSWAGQRGSGNPRLMAYAASKAAVAATTKTVAKNFAAEGVLAYCISPGAVRTEMTMRSAASQGGEEAVSAALTMGEFVPPSEIAEIVAFLATGRARHLSGATLDVNGASYIR
jgi:NAD(P)-dependent dehydrogenase (short-subunit alcohol dehydrogenase family)